jgi:hypothetical protein
MTWYLGFSLQEPFDFGQDERHRCVYAMNVEAKKRQSSTFIEEVLFLLEDAGLGTQEVDLFGTSVASIPDGDGPYLNLMSVPGAGPLEVKGGPGYVQPRARLLVHAKVSAVAKAKAHEAYTALRAIRNREVEIDA